MSPKLLVFYKPVYTIALRYVQTSVYEFAEAGTRVLQVSATDVECANSSCITYSLEPADNNSAFVIDSQTGSFYSGRRFSSLLFIWTTQYLWTCLLDHHSNGWLRDTVVERWSFAGDLSLSCARLAAGGWPLMWVNHRLQVNQPGQLSLSSFRGR